MNRECVHDLIAPEPYFFGYGSLVHRGTHDYPDASRAQLSGWRREWCATTLRDVAFLSVKPCEKTIIDGLVARVPNADWSALDIRERAYDRHEVSDRIEVAKDMAPQIQVYAVANQNRDGTSPRVLLLSYIDVVVQGFLREFGNAGVRRFFETTDGWQANVVDDRSDPRYSRHQSLTPSEREFVDHLLIEYGANRVLA